MIPDRLQDFYGDQVRWFTGLVVDINDPLKLGRIKVRIYGVHSDDKQAIPDDDLPWAQTVTPITEGGTTEWGNPLGVQPNAMVFGFFMDGQSSQLPLILGSMPKYEGPDRDIKSVNRLARGENTITRTPNTVIGEPDTAYDAKYPHNKVTQTTSGHVIEIDDTPDAERIHVFHKSGTFIEMRPNGDVVTQHKNGWRSVTGDDKLYVSNNLDIQVAGNLNIEANTGTIQIGEGDVIASQVSLVTHIHNNQDGPLTGPGPTSPPYKTGQEFDGVSGSGSGSGSDAVIADPLLVAITFDT